MRKRVRTCSESNSIAPRLVTGSDCARYFMASTNKRWPSTYRGSVVRSRFLRPRSGGTVIVKTLAMKICSFTGNFGKYSVPCNVFQPYFYLLQYEEHARALPLGRDHFCLARGLQFENGVCEFLVDPYV